MDARYGTGVGDLNVFAELLLVLAFHFGDGRLEPVLGRFVEAFGTAGGENHARGRTRGGLSEQAAAYHRSLSWVISWSGWGAAARVWAPARGNAAGADCGSSRTADKSWRRSSCRCGGHELRRANPDTFHRGTGRRDGRIRRTARARRRPGAGRRGYAHRANPGTSGGFRRA